jgi:hypothetical protein
MITLDLLIRRERELTGALAEIQGMIAHVQSENAKKIQEKQEPKPGAAGDKK